MLKCHWVKFGVLIYNRTAASLDVPVIEIVNDGILDIVITCGRTFGRLEK